MTDGRPSEPRTESPEFGTVCRLDPQKRFGYVRTADGLHAYIFVVGRALSHRTASQLTVGTPVQFKVAERGRVEELVLRDNVASCSDEDRVSHRDVG